MRRHLALCLLLIVSCAKTIVPEEFVISVSYDPSSLDPHASNTISNFAVSCNFYEPLVRTDSYMKVQPALAESWENPDSLTWIFHLRKGVRFHLGKPMDSADVVYSFRRLLDHPELEMQSFLFNVSEVAAIDSHNVRIRTVRPLASLLSKLNFIAVIPDGSNSETLHRAIDGTGPFRLERWTGDNLRMARYDHYWGERPHFQTVTYLLNRSPRQSMDDLKTGKAQLARSNTRDLQKLVQSVPDLELLIHDSVFVKYLAFDVSREVTPYCDLKTNPFRNKLVREAFHNAIDRKEMAERLPSFAIPLNQPVPPFVFGFNPQIPETPYNLERARQLLAESGFPGGFSATLHTRNIYPEASALIREQLSKIGIRLKIELLSTGDFYQRLGRRDTSLFLTGLGAATGDATIILELALHSRNEREYLGEANWGGYINPNVDAAIESSVSIAHTELRRRAYQEILATVMEDLPWIPLYIDQEAYAISRALEWKPRYDSYVIGSEVRLRKKVKR